LPIAGADTDGPPDPAASESPGGQAYAILNPDGSLAGIARLDPAGLLRPRLVFDAAG
jgi:tRNA pseudouridine55 synthase